MDEIKYKTRELAQVDRVEYIRTKNNRNWMDILRLALEVAPNRTKRILKDIADRDEQVTAEVRKMLD
jgi:hypothetical protein